MKTHRSPKMNLAVARPLSRKEFTSANIGFGISGAAEISVVENGKVIKRYPRIQNLILNNFMEAGGSGGTLHGLSNVMFADMFLHGVASTNPLATTVDSGVTTAVQDGTPTTNRLTVSGGSFAFVSGDVGNLIKIDTGAQAGQVRRITAFVSSSAVDVVPSTSSGGTISAGEFTLYRTNQTSMASTADEERTNTYLTGAGNCGASESTPGTYLLFRTFDFAIRANGARGTSTDSGTTQASQTGTTVTLSGGSFLFTAGDVGKTITWDSAPTAVISAVAGDGLSATVSPSQSVGAGEFTVSGTPYKELGWSNQPSVGNPNLNSRIVIPDPGVPVELGQQLRVKYILTVTLSPITNEAISPNPVTNWPAANGIQQICRNHLSTIQSSTGATQGYAGSGISPLEPSNVGTSNVASLSTVATAPSTYVGNTSGGQLGAEGGGVNRFYASWSSSNTDSGLQKSPTSPTFSSPEQAESANTITMSKVADWAANVGNTPGQYRSITLGRQESPTPHGGLDADKHCFAFTYPSVDMPKDVLHSLTINFKFSWSRTLA